MLKPQLQQRTHEQRKNTDPIYRLLFFPAEDGFVDLLLQAGLMLLERKYGPRMKQFFEGKERRFSPSSIFAPGGAKIEDPTPKLFAVLAILHREPEFQECVARMYQQEQESSLFPSGKQQFQRFLNGTLHTFMQKTLNWPYDRQTTPVMLDNFRAECGPQYIME